MTNVSIREATESDVGLILSFIIELAIYEKAEVEVCASEDDIQQSLFSNKATAKALICSIDSKPVGYAVYFYNYSTWLGKNGLYLEDLYIAPKSRGLGAGTAMLKYLANVSIMNNCGRFEWSVLDWNSSAHEFYQSLGAEPQSEWVNYRITGSALQKMAGRITTK